jgi:GNAT superfamily N-acetyltransferase
MTITVVSLTRAEIEALQPEITAVYREAFSRPPYSKPELEVRLFERALPDHVERESFRLVGALTGEPGTLLGFAYGYTCAAGQWWRGIVGAALPAPLMSTWPEGSFQFAEIAVRPEAQGQGIGGRLHDHLLDGLPHQRAVLSTLRAETPAYHLYRNRGWVVLQARIDFPGIPRPYRILGLELGRRRGAGCRGRSGMAPGRGCEGAGQEGSDAMAY